MISWKNARNTSVLKKNETDLQPEEESCLQSDSCEGLG